MRTEAFTWQPEWAVPPGEILLESLQDRGMSQAELARRMGRPTKTINEIVNGKTAITPETAIQLELTLGIAARFWNNLETTYREHIARQRSLKEMETSADWAAQFPIKDLVKHKLIARTQGKADQVASLLSYFGVGSRDAWEGQWLAPSASFRSSPAFEASPPAVAAWLRWGERLASEIDTAPFDARRLREAVLEIRPLTRQADFMQAVRSVQDTLAGAGVVLVLTPEFSGTHLSGAARWLAPDRALVQLSMRYKSNDHFWFSLFHEIGHLLEPKHLDYVDLEDGGGGGDTEDEADRFARDALVPPAQYVPFVEASVFTEQAIRDLAKSIGVAPGIVVGRLQRDGHVDRSHLNELKKSLRWAIAT
jgi:HTH-type transcriptional regulator/antitoxin HigA